MFPPLGNVRRCSHVNILLAVFLLSLAGLHLRMQCLAVLTTRISTTNALPTISTPPPANNSSQQARLTSLANSLRQQLPPTTPANIPRQKPPPKKPTKKPPRKLHGKVGKKTHRKLPPTSPANIPTQKPPPRTPQQPPPKTPANNSSQESPPKTPANNSSQEAPLKTPANNSLETLADDGSFRLPTSVLPVHYDLELQPYINYTDPANFTFRGSVSIMVRCVNATNKITFHKEILTVDESSILFKPQTASVSGDPNVTSVDEVPNRQFFIIRLDKDMEAGKKYLIEMSFTSPLTNDNIGLYYYNYSRGNDTVYTVVSQLETVYARRTFPCFDEPAMRATFTVTIVRPEHLLSLSNMPIAHSNTTFTESGVTYVKDVYERTPSMSTYLLAFVVGDFVQLSSKTKSNVTYNTWAKPEVVNKTQYVLDIFVKLHDYFEEYFDIKYPLPKVDVVAVPDFRFGAMENLGIIITRESFMVYEEGVTSEWYWRVVTRIAAHEAVHMWVGNIVTLKWWDEIWIKEGFATYLEYSGVENVTYDWKMFEHFIAAKHHVAFTIDDTADSRPLYVEEKLVQVKKLANFLFYSKGAVVARMLSFVLGDSTFQKAFRNFLKRRLWGTFAQQDLYDEMTLQARADGLEFDVKEFMDTWVLQGNFPVVTVTQDFGTCQLHVAQQRFLENPKDKDTGKFISPFNFRWNIPLTFVSSKHPVFTQTGEDVYWLKRDEPAKTICVNFSLPSCSDRNGWILANVDAIGFYRVNYHIGNWLALSRQLKRNHLVIAVSNRAQIIDDAFSLYKANYIPLNTALTTLEYVHQEREFLPWGVAVNKFSYIGKKMVFTPLYEQFEKFMQKQLTPAFERFSFTGVSDNINKRKMHALLASQACHYGVKLCLDQARQMYRDLINSDGKSYVHPDLKSALYCGGVAAGSQTEWKFALKVYKRTTDSHEQRMLIEAMACARRSHNFIQYNTTFDCKKALPQLTAAFNREEDLRNVSFFWVDRCSGYKKTDFENAVKKPIKENIEWLKKYSPIIQAWMNKNNTQT